MALDLMERDLSSICDMLTALTVEELEMDGAGAWSNISGGVVAIGAISTSEFGSPPVVAIRAFELTAQDVYNLTGW